jgi:hypothetical protein
LKETRPLWPPQRGVGLREPNLGKTNPCVSPLYSLAICFTPSRGLVYISNANRACSCDYFKEFQFRRIHPPPLGDYHKQVLILETRGKETQLYNTTMICLSLGGRKKHTRTTDKLFLQVQTSTGGAAAPSASSPPSTESGPAPDGDTGRGSPPRRRMSAPHLGHHR